MNCIFLLPVFVCFVALVRLVYILFEGLETTGGFFSWLFTMSIWATGFAIVVLCMLVSMYELFYPIIAA